MHIRLERTAHLAFLLFLIGGPILPYLAAMLFTDVQLHSLSDEVQNIPVYPGAQLVHTDFQPIASSFNESHAWSWELEYETADDMSKVVGFYRGALPLEGWVYHPSWGRDIYKRDGLSIVLGHEGQQQGDKTVFAILVVSEYFSDLFDLRY